MIEKIRFVAIEIYILLAIVFLDRKFLDVISIIYITIVLLCNLIDLKSYKGRHITKSTLYGLLLLFVSAIIIIFKSKYTCNNSLMVFAFIFVSYLIFDTNRIPLNKHRLLKWFDIFLTIGLWGNWLKSAVTNISDFTLFVLPSAWDKNYTGITIYLIFVYFYKRKNVIGIIVCILYTVTLQSRLLVLIISIFIIMTLLLGMLEQKSAFEMNHFILQVRGKGIFFILIICSVLIMALSFFWTYYVSNNGVGEYRQSINDSSNAIRMRSNLYAINLMIKDHDLLFFGYDDDIKLVLGVEDENSATVYSGYRLVQPHNLFLNLCLKHGVFFSCVYLFLVSKLLSLYWSKDNLPCIISFIFANMFMHSLLSTTYLLLFFFVLSIGIEEKQRIKIKVKI